MGHGVGLLDVRADAAVQMPAGFENTTNGPKHIDERGGETRGLTRT